MNAKYYPYIGIGILAVGAGGYLLYKNSVNNSLDDQINKIKKDSPVDSETPLTNAFNTVENVISGIGKLFGSGKATVNKGTGDTGNGNNSNNSDYSKSTDQTSEDANYYYYADGSKQSKYNGYTYYSDGSVSDSDGIMLSN